MTLSSQEMQPQHKKMGGVANACLGAYVTVQRIVVWGVAQSNTMEKATLPFQFIRIPFVVPAIAYKKASSIFFVVPSSWLYVMHS